MHSLSDACMAEIRAWQFVLNLIILNTKSIISNTKFIIVNTKSINFNTNPSFSMQNPSFSYVPQHRRIAWPLCAGNSTTGHQTPAPAPKNSTKSVAKQPWDSRKTVKSRRKSIENQSKINRKSHCVPAVRFHSRPELRVHNCKHYSFSIQNSSCLIQNPSFLIQKSSFILKIFIIFTHSSRSRHTFAPVNIYIYIFICMYVCM